MKKIIFVLGTFMLLSGLGFYYVYHTYYKSSTDIWQMIPGNAIFVYENQNVIANWNQVVNKPVWNTLKKVPKFDDFENDLAQLDSITGKDGTLDKLFKNRNFLVSAHIITSTNFDFLIFLEIADDAAKSSFMEIKTAVENDYKFTESKRNFQNYEITELKNKATGKVFSFLVYDDILAGSFTPFLIEDVIRNINNNFEDNFSEKISTLKDLSKLENDEGNVYVDFARLPDLMAVFVKPDLAENLRGFEHFANDTYLDLKITDHEILLNGISTLENGAGNENFINVFRNQNARGISVTGVMPEQTALLYHLAFSDFKNWQNELIKHWSMVDEEQFQNYLDFESDYQLNLDWIGDEIAMAILEPYSETQLDQVIFIKVKDQDLAASELLNFTQQYIEKSGDSLYMENYEGNQIIQIGFKDFPSILLGPSFSGFDNSFFTYYEDYFILSNRMNGIKTVLNEIRDENTWSKSIRHNLFLENTLGEASISLMLSTSKCWNFLQQNLNTEWAKVFNQYQTQITAFDLMAFQVSNLENRYYTSIAVGHNKPAPIRPIGNTISKSQSIHTLSPITSKPHIVTNHNNYKHELLVQDSLNILYLISNEGDILWGDSLSGKIVTEIHQIDFYKNKKLQYLFGTENQIHLIDRNGDYLTGYPFRMPVGKEIEYLTVVDYDNSKRYRFMVSDKTGNIYMFDKNMNNLEGWRPRKMSKSLNSPPFHFRVKGGDCMVGFQEDGILNVMKRRATLYPGFPVNFNANISSPLFVERGNDFSTTRLTAVSDLGEIYQVNLKGKTTNRKQLYRASSESKFRLVADALGKDYIIVRQDFNNLAFLNQNGETIFEKNFITSGNLMVQYYNFAMDNKMFIVTDIEQEFAYVYDISGQLINFEPVESGFQVALLYSSKSQEYRLYKCYNNELAVLSFK